MRKWNSTVQILKYQGSVVIANSLNGSWMRLSKEVYDVICEVLKEESSKRIEFEDKEDEDYINNIMLSLEKTESIISKNEIELQNRTVSLEITHRCNLKCIHCCVDADNVHRTKEFSADDIKYSLKKCVGWNPESIMLSGGEPLLRKDFKEILIYLRECYTGKIVISTNGTLITQEMAQILSQYSDQIDISLDGVDEETTSIVRGAGVFTKVMKAVELLHNENFWEITLSIAIGDRNQHLEKKFDELCECLKVTPIKRLFSAVGRGENAKPIFSDKTEQEVYIPEDYLSVDFDEPFGVCSCSGGTKEVFVSYDGNIYPCPSFVGCEYKMGNIYDEGSLDELVQKTQINLKEILHKKVETFAGDRCKNCKVEPFCWTCPGSILEIKSKAAFDDRCYKMCQILYKRVWGKEYDLYNMDYNRM